MSLFVQTRAAATALLFLGACALALPTAAQTGSRFRVTSKMEMVGMPFAMPAQTSEVCGPKTGVGQSMVPKQDNCKVSNYRAAGNKSSFDMVCTGRDAMSGRGEFESLGPNGYRGRMTMLVEGQQMVMNFEGKRIGDCNYATESPQAQAQAVVNKSCGQLLAEPAKTLVLASAQFVAPGAMCAAQKKAYCGKITPLATDLAGLRERDVLDKQLRGQGGTIGSQWDAFQGCGLSRAAVLASACKSAEAKGDLDFIGGFCPTLVARACTTANPSQNASFVIDHCSARAQQLAAQHCAGRDFTAMRTSPYSGFCSRFAASRLQQRNPGR